MVNGRDRGDKLGRGQTMTTSVKFDNWHVFRAGGVMKDGKVFTVLPLAGDIHSSNCTVVVPPQAHKPLIK